MDNKLLKRVHSLLCRMQITKDLVACSFAVASVDLIQGVDGVDGYVGSGGEGGGMSIYPSSLPLPQ